MYDITYAQIISLKPLDYIEVYSGDIYIIRFNNTKGSYALAALIYRRINNSFFKVKSFTAHEQRFEKFISSAYNFDKNIYKVQYQAIKRTIPSIEVPTTNCIGLSYQIEHPAQLGLFGSRLLFDKTQSDYDYILPISTIDEFNHFKMLLSNNPDILKYDESYFSQKAIEYADVSRTTPKTLLALTIFSLLYYSIRGTSTELAFFPRCFDSTINEQFEQILDHGFVESKTEKLEGEILKDQDASSFSYPRVFHISTNSGLITIYSLLWRIAGITLLSGKSLKIRAQRIGNTKYLLGSNGKWEII